MLELQTEKREIFGKKLKPFRKQGKLPAVLYGPKEKSQPLFVLLKDFKKLWKEAGESTVIQLNLEKSKPARLDSAQAKSGRKEVLIQDVAMDPIKDEPVHVDFYAVQMDKPIEASVALEFSGISHAVKNLGGVLVKVMHEIDVEALPKNLPHELVVEISKLEKFEDKILARDIVLPEGVKLIANPEEVIALVEEQREEEIAPPAEEKIAFEEIEVAGAKEKEEKEEKEEEKDKKISNE